jgi:hypothetical protein
MLPLISKHGERHNQDDCITDHRNRSNSSSVMNPGVRTVLLPSALLQQPSVTMSINKSNSARKNSIILNSFQFQPIPFPQIQASSPQGCIAHA